jgi:hypothetical protein
MKEIAQLQILKDRLNAAEKKYGWFAIDWYGEVRDLKEQIEDLEDKILTS